MPTIIGRHFKDKEIKFNYKIKRGNSMYCNKCGKEISKDSQFCQFCGNKININIKSDDTKSEQKKGKVIIHSYEEVYMLNPNIKVYIDGKLIASLAKGQTFEYDIDKSTTITFKSSIRSTTVTVSPNAITEITLIWNRATGKLETICNEQNYNGVNNYANQQNYQGQLNAKKHSNEVWLVITPILTILLFFFFKFLSNIFLR